MKQLKQFIPHLAVALVTAVFFAFGYPHHLHYAEQLQLFQNTWQYFASTIAVPGGMSLYAGRWITQLMLFPWAGAIAIACVGFSILELARRIACTYHRSLGIAAATAVALLTIQMLLDRHALLAGPISILFTLAAIRLLLLLQSHRAQFVALPFAAAALYWIAGGVGACTLIAFMLVHAIISKRADVTTLLLWAAAVVTVALAPQIARQHLGLMMSLEHAFRCTVFNRFPNMMPNMPYVIAAIVALLPALKLISAKRTTTIAAWVAAAAATGIAIGTNINMDDEEVMTYDYYGQTRQWDAIIKLADSKPPRHQITIMYLNMALAQKNLLGERLFRYSQHGTEGLLPKFAIDHDMPMASSDIFYHLGFVNTAEQLTFEAQEALPDYQKSARTITRLAEANIVKEDYAVAKKYLYMLQQTTFHRKWATECLNLIETGQTHTVKEWQKLRGYLIQKDFILSEEEYDQMLGLLFTTNNSNKLAFDYLMAFCLLNKDTEHYAKYAPIGAHLYPNALPKAYHEAFLYHLSQTAPHRLTPQNMSMADRQCMRRMSEFGTAYNRYKNVEMLRNKFSDTYWFYLLSK